MPAKKLTNEIITAAIEGFEAQKVRIDGQIAELRAMLSGGPVRSTNEIEPTARKKRKMSAAGRKAISEATKKRWAAFHAAKAGTNPQQAEPRRTKVKKSAQRNVVAKTARARAANKRGPAKTAAATKTA